LKAVARFLTHLTLRSSHSEKGREMKTGLRTRLVLATLVFLSLGSFSVAADSPQASAVIANNTFYWNTTQANVCSSCQVNINVVAFPTIYTAPTANSSLLFQSPSYCAECVQFLAPGAVSAFGYWFIPLSYINQNAIDWGTVGFLVGFTNQS
jgi:hypothetical protein